MKGLLIFIISILGIGVSIFSAVVYRKNSSPKFFLSLFVLLITVSLFIIAIIANYGHLNHPLINIISLLFYVLLLLIPPNMYLYVDQYLGGQTVSQTVNNNIVHYFPAIALGLTNIAAFPIMIASFYRKVVQILLFLLVFMRFQKRWNLFHLCFTP